MNIVVPNRQGKKLSVQMVGPKDAPTVLFSNSLGTDHRMWALQVSAMAEDYRVVTYDTRGHGLSDVIEKTTLQDLGNDVIDILNYLEIEKLHFCGISLGGLTGLWLGVNYPHRLLSLTAANTAARIGTPAAWNARADEVTDSGLSALVTSTHLRWFSRAFDYKNNSVAMRTIQSLGDTSLQGYVNACQALATGDLRQQLEHINIPVLIVAGLLDPVTTIEDGEFMHARIAGSRLFKIEASHLSNIEQPESFNQALRAFIKSAG
jgi:3-oxoadipate enol-lactonase